MTGIEPATDPDRAIAASWERCERQHRLRRDAVRPIMRLQKAELAPRLAQTVERTGGRQGIFRQLAALAAKAGHCLIVTDADGIVVRLEAGDAGSGARAGMSHGRGGGEEWHGIALGSCWDERLAGTNGVAMALREGTAFTVRGRDHYYAGLRPFACTAVPLLDAENRTVGAVTLAAIDRGSAADYLFARHLLGAASDRIQRILFRKRFAEAMLVGLSVAGPGDMGRMAEPVGGDAGGWTSEGMLARGDELIALDEAGIVLGGTARAHRLAGLASHDDLKGQSFLSLFGAEGEALGRVPERVMSLRPGNGRVLQATAVAPDARTQVHRPVRTSGGAAARPLRRRLSPSLQALALGSPAMAAACERAQACFRRGLPFLLEGETGTGKTALVAALHHARPGRREGLVTVDCATLGEGPEDRRHLQAVLAQARAAGALAAGGTLVFDNVEELPAYAQAALRHLLDELEGAGGGADAHAVPAAPRIVGLCRASLAERAGDGRFRDDLYYLLAGTSIELPPLRRRERRATIARALAARMAGQQVEITAEAQAILTTHAFPGNLRELRNVLEQALLAGDGRRISAVDLRSTTVAPGRRRAGIASGTGHPVGGRVDERALIEDALAGARWNVSQAARALGIGRATINRKMKRYGITRPH